LSGGLPLLCRRRWGGDRWGRFFLRFLYPLYLLCYLPIQAVRREEVGISSTGGVVLPGAALYNETHIPRLVFSLLEGRCSMKRTLSIIGAILLLALILQPVAAAPVRWTILGNHTVRYGETLFCIGRAYGVDPWAIASQNGVVNPHLIYAGMVLAIPAAYAALPAGPVCVPQFGGAPPGPCACASHYTIVSGDTLTKISLNTGVSIWRIAECNNIYNLNYIRAGDSLCIPNP
jgi:LysM repeat protein